jgi:hypothetical protein
MRRLLIPTSLMLFCVFLAGQACAYELVLENYALGKSVTTSGDGYGWVRERLVDGNAGLGWHSPSNAVTNWAEVDLGQPRDFDRIEIWNRTDCCWLRTNGVFVLALDSARNVVFQSAPISGITDGNRTPVIQYDNAGAGLSGVRYIRLERTNAEYFNIMELRALKVRKVAFLPNDSNLTQYGAVAEESTPNASYPASNAIDGAITNFTHTDEATPNNWWKVTLARESYISKIVVYNRQSCCGNRLLNQVLTVSNDKGDVLFMHKFMAEDGVANGSVHSFDMPPVLYGRVIKIGLENGEANGQPIDATHPANYTVSLAEVQVIGGDIQGTWSPAPANGAVEMDTTQVLSWKPGEDPNGVVEGTTGYRLYFSADKLAVDGRTAGAVQGGLIPVGSESFNPGALAKDTTYYWAVDQRLQDDPNTIPGITWRFTTKLTLPVIGSQPSGVVTIEGGYAKFTVSATDPLGGVLTYAWRKVGNSTVLSTTDTLELSNVSAANAGQYVCDVMNINKIQTNPAELKVAKPVVRWKFDETAGKTATDSSGNGINGTLGDGFSDNEWVVDGGRTGQSGDNAIFFPGNASATITALGVDLTSKPVNNIFLGASSWTINLWLKIPSTNRISMIGGFGDNVFVDGSGLNDRYYNTWNGTIEFNFGEDGFWENTFTAGQWQMWTLTYDGLSDTLTYYRDRVAIATKTVSLINVTENAVKLGVGTVAWATAQVPLEATIDDFSIWDEALGPFELGMLEKGFGCVTAIQGDVNGDCQVNVADLVRAVSSWMDCGLVPNCL